MIDLRNIVYLRKNNIYDIPLRNIVSPHKETKEETIVIHFEVWRLQSFSDAFVLCITSVVYGF